MVWTAYSTTAASNNSAPPAGAPEGMNPSDVNDTMRAMMAEIRTLGDYTSGAWTDIASAGTVNIGAAAQAHLRVTGTTTITAFDSVTSGIWRRLRFAGALTLTYNGTSLILPGAASITTAAGDTADVVSLGSGNWICTQYTKASGAPPANVLPSASTSWTPGFTGFSADPTVTASYQKIGKMCSIYLQNVSSGTSNSTAFTITGLPFTSAGTPIIGTCVASDSGSIVLSSFYVAAGGTTIILSKSGATPTTGNNWTNSGAKGSNLNFVYETV